MTLLCGHWALAQESKITTIVKAGYKHISLNLNVLSPSPAAKIDLYIRDASCLTGSLGIVGQSGRLFGSMAIEATAFRDVDVVTPENQPWSGRPLPFQWPGSCLSTWDIDGTISWLFNPRFGTLAGLRYDNLTVALGIPTDGAGATLIPPGIVANFGGNLTANTWIPYFGLRIAESGFTAILLYSPLASTRTATSQSGDGPTGPSSYELNLWDWNINGTGSFAEMAMDYNAYSSANVACSMWGKATWMKISGLGQWKFV